MRAIEYGSGEACITKAKLHRQQEFGFKQDKQEVNKLIKLAKQYDKIIFEPYLSKSMLHRTLRLLDGLSTVTRDVDMENILVVIG